MTSVVVFLVLLFLFLGVLVLGEILFAVGINFDAKGNYNQNPLMWALLVGFVGWIPAVIYFCTRKNNVRTVGCPHCRSILPEPMGQCRFCGQATNLVPEDPTYIAWRRKGKNLMIWGGVLWLIGLVLFLVAYILLFATMFNSSAFQRFG